ncbi:MAG: radical SAM protein [Eubacterium sp.]|nr:radical SAM protein [Eubacterium sp.]
MHLIKSKYLYVYHFDNKVVFWNSLYMNVTVFYKELAEKILNGLDEKKTRDAFVSLVGDEIMQMLENNHYICEEGEETFEVLNKYKTCSEIDIQTLVLLITNLCNFDCVYCQIEKNLAKENELCSMSREVADQALNYFNLNCSERKNKTVTITGGEPLLNWDVVSYIIEKVRKEFDSTTRIVIFTNGSLITKSIASFFKEYNVQVLVSLDGPEKIFNCVRLTKDGTDGFDQAIRGYNILVEEGCNVGISAVGGIHNVEKMDELKEFFSRLKPSSVGFNISHMLIDKDNPTYISSQQYAELLIELYEYLADKGIYLENISRSINSFVKKQPRLRECQAQGHGITVAPNGKYGPCKSLLVSDVFALDLKNNEKVCDQDIFKKWAKRNVATCSNCTNCPALTICGGGCGYDSYIKNNGNFQEIDNDICSYSKTILEYLLLSVANKAKVTESGFYELDSVKAEEIFRWFVNKENELQKSVGHE